MFRRILLPTDGSTLSREAAASGIAFAREAGAAVLACHVLTLPPADRLDAWLHRDPHHAQRFRELFESIAGDYLAPLAAAAAAQGVPCTCMKAHGRAPARALAAMAMRERCDLIYMASHGWRGDGGKWPGSVTLEVLRHSPVPVLVHKVAGPDAAAGQRAEAGA